MEVIKKLELELQKYLRLRKVFHMFEFVCLAAIFIVFLFSGGGDVAEIFGFVAAVMIVPESFLSVRRSEIKASIKNENLLANAELDFCSKMKAEFEKIKDEIISLGTHESDAEEFKQLIWKEEMGIGWLSTKIKEFEKRCNEAKQIMKSLESIKKRLVIF
jgi:hypothetical protein